MAEERGFRRTDGFYTWGVLMLSLWGSGFLFGCDCAGLHPRGGPCASAEPPEACGQDCTGGVGCASGFYCAAQGVCTADCDPTDPGEVCGAGRCTSNGRCITDPGADAALDASGDGNTGTDTNHICADVRVMAQRVTPTVVLIIDQSGSMTARFGDSNRWDSLRDSLMDDPAGLISELQSSVRFGAALYSARADDDETIIGECPLVTYIPPALDNHAAIDAVYSLEEPIDETPTGDAMMDILSRFTSSPDPSEEPTIFILATDGEPDSCAEPNPQRGQPQAIAAAEAAFAAGIRTFVISVGDDVGEAHLQDMANAGLGRGPGDPDAEFWVAGDDTGLRDALTTIIGGELSCTLELSGRIQDLAEACSGTVRLNGLPLTCDDPNGWRAIDETHIEIQGTACDRLLSDPAVTLEATFPCGLILF